MGSRIMDPNVIGSEHYDIARGVQKILQDYKSLQDIIAILGMDELSEEDKLKVARARKIEMIEGGVISLKGKTSKVALVYGQMNEPPGARARVALTGLTVAEYFRDQEGQDVLLFIDNIFR